jgi:hypothetical protein
MYAPGRPVFRRRGEFILTTTKKGGNAMYSKLLMATAALFLVAGPAAAATVKNTSDSEITIGIDHGDKEKVEKVPAGGSAKLDCKEGCGVTGPWGFSWMVSEGDTVTTDGSSMVTVKQ